MSNREVLNYVQVVCECPHGHVLGTIVATQSGYWWGDRPLRDAKPDNEKLLETVRITAGDKVSATCRGCAKNGRHGTNYQASWQRVSGKLAEARDTRAERVSLTLG
jgi:hypothetical protein